MPATDLLALAERLARRDRPAVPAPVSGTAGQLAESVGNASSLAVPATAIVGPTTGQTHSRPCRASPIGGTAPVHAGQFADWQRLPPAWPGYAARPAAGGVCACCRGRAWWGDAAGWRCTTCHPPLPGANPESMET